MAQIISKFQITEDSFTVRENGEEIFVKMKENNNIITTSFENLDTNESGYFIRDENKGTIYSSITGLTIKLNNVENIAFQKNNELSLFSYGDTYLYSGSITFSTIINLVGVSATLTTAGIGIAAFLGVVLQYLQQLLLQ